MCVVALLPKVSNSARLKKASDGLEGIIICYPTRSASQSPPLFGTNGVDSPHTVCDSHPAARPVSHGVTFNLELRADRSLIYWEANICQKPTRRHYIGATGIWRNVVRFPHIRFPPLKYFSQFLFIHAFFPVSRRRNIIDQKNCWSIQCAWHVSFTSNLLGSCLLFPLLAGNSRRLLAKRKDVLLGDECMTEPTLTQFQQRKRWISQCWFPDARVRWQEHDLSLCPSTLSLYSSANC